MGEYGNLLDRMVVKVSSPDGRIHAKLSERSNIEIGFYDDGYYQYDDPDTLEYQLEAIGRLLLVGRIRGAREAWKNATGEEPYLQGMTKDTFELEYDAERAAIEAVGWSKEEYITITVRNWSDWSVEIKEGKLDSLSEDEFVAEVNSGIADLMEDYRFQLRKLREIYNEKLRRLR